MPNVSQYDAQEINVIFIGSDSITVMLHYSVSLLFFFLIFSLDCRDDFPGEVLVL